MSIKKYILGACLGLCVSFVIVQLSYAAMFRIDDDTLLDTNDKSFAITAQLAPNIWQGEFYTDIYSHGGMVKQNFKLIFHLNNSTGAIDLQMINTKTGQVSSWERVKLDQRYPKDGGSLTYKYITTMTYLQRPDVLPESTADKMFQQGYL